MTISTEIKTKIEDVTKKMLGGAPADYAAYASLVARYRVLKELADYLAEHADTGDDAPNDRLE